MTTNKVLIWLKEFKRSWLPQNISNDNHLMELITNKLRELEQLLIQNNQDENEILFESEHQCAQSNGTEQMVLSTEQRSLPTPPDIHNQIDDKNEVSYRPAIRIKRISLAEAENFLPPIWKTTKSKPGRKKGKQRISKFYSTKKKHKKNIQTNKVPSSSTQVEIPIPSNSNGARKSTRSKKSTIERPSTTVTTTQSINNDKKKGKRKLRAIDAEDDDLYILGNLSQTENLNGNTDCDQISRYIGQNGILSQTRKNNETSITYDDDFTIKLHSRQSNQNKTRYSNDTGITTESVPIDLDISPLVDEHIFTDLIENHDTESLFTSLDLTHDRSLEPSSTLTNTSRLNYIDCIEDITNDGIDPPPATSSPHLDHLSLTT